MDPLDPEYSYKFLTSGPPIKVEKVLNYDIKESFKSPYVWGPIVAGVLAGAYYWLNSNEEDQQDDDDDNGNQEAEGSNLLFDAHHHDNRLMTTTTTTTTTTTFHDQQPNNRTTLIHPPQFVSSVPPPCKLKDRNGTPLPLEEQNQILQRENEQLRTQNNNLVNWFNDQMGNINDRLQSLEKSDKRIKFLEFELERERLCNICEENEKQVSWGSCGHRLCSRCAVVILQTNKPKCSMCRTHVSNYNQSWS
ncbi:hypothetical protein CYY_005667 [Polysphondylium violaceum]|uniref:RING-type domain-containing protein n=1 Tax=Polysphondylium violaceum TaxID=133409 RepID=A0A8J4US10_9MYCE|nr:hypothetical protein CYY_005667 [Polysphondylium violaceum]